VGQDKVNAAVEEVIRKMVNNPKFQTALKQKIGSKIDIAELDKEKVVLNKQLQQAIDAKKKLPSRWIDLILQINIMTENMRRCRIDWINSKMRSHH